MPFSVEQFLQVFADYNRAVFPFQLALVVMALVVAVLAAKPFSSSNKIVSLFLAFLWLWMGVAYHLAFFSKINPAAFLFATLFIAQGGLFFHEGVVRDRLEFRARQGLRGIMGLVLVLYALIAYPILGYAMEKPIRSARPSVFRVPRRYLHSGCCFGPPGRFRLFC